MICPHETILQLSARLDRAEQPGAATLLRDAPLALGVELLPLFESLVGAIEDLTEEALALRGAALLAEGMLAGGAIEPRTLKNGTEVVGVLDAGRVEALLVRLRSAMGAS